ncbi:ImmA/IrrE family metallo-endopeptidase [Cumulibacter manganitolerans]|uniref:ImmA/IrrE family metallo-endopeptidase n=1 Tax=Cumulibacter manganitolerans TaxID=1884992 RepID=UPI001297C7A7|nr:ImmA/IrrE family metallo-endopeptidase [Cumulibacter manganitolerans]
MSQQTIDHTATRAALTQQAAAFMENPAGWPAAMAARALRLRAGHPAYSPNNQALILSQLWDRFAGAGMNDADAFAAATQAAAEEIAPAYVWRRRGFTPHGPALAIYSRPIPVWVDPETGKKCPNDTAGAVRKTVFKIERTYRAQDVTNEHGETAAAAYAAPELPAGEARDVFERLAAWITAQGWSVTRSPRDTAAGGSTAHAARAITINGALAGWAAVETLAHEIAHALLHGATDERPYAGDHRGDMEAEAEAVAFGLLTAYGQGDLARGSARYAAEWTRDPQRVAIAYERASHVLDAVAAVANGAKDVSVQESTKAAKAAATADNKALAAALRAAGLQPCGEAWTRAKAGEPITAIAAALNP